MYVVSVYTLAGVFMDKMVTPFGGFAEIGFWLDERGYNDSRYYVNIHFAKSALDVPNVASYPIEELELGVRIYNVLKRMNVNTFGDLAKVSVHDLNDWYQARLDNGEHEVAICGDSLRDLMEKQRDLTGQS